MKKLLFLTASLLSFLTMTCMLLPDKKNVATQSQQDSVKQKDAIMPKLCHMPDNFRCDTSVRFKFVLSKSELDSITTVNSARFTRAFQKLYGDSLLYEAVDRGEWCGLDFSVNWDGSIDIISDHTNRKFIQSPIHNFVMEHFWDIVKESISMYDYLYAFSYKKSYLNEIKSSNGLYISVFIPSGVYTYTYFLMARREKDPKSFFDELYSYEFAPLRTSIDEGIYPEDYNWIQKEAVMRISPQPRKEAAKQDTASTPSSDKPKEIIFF